MRTWLPALGLLVSTSPALVLAEADPTPEALPALSGVHRVVFVGDSITYAGQFIEFAEAVGWLGLRYSEAPGIVPWPASWGFGVPQTQPPTAWHANPGHPPCPTGLEALVQPKCTW